MNNAIYRSGHLQNSITIDPNNIERAEVIFGSSSVGYGSDAMGGVVHYYTKDPVLKSSKKLNQVLPQITLLQINLSLITSLLTTVKKIGEALHL